jgi:hypothetical protein
MSDGTELFDEEISSAPVETPDAFAEAPSAPEVLSAPEPVDQGSQTQPSDAVPTQTEYQEPQAPQIDPQWIGAAHLLGIQNPQQYAPEQLAYEIRRRNSEVQQQIQFARHAQGDWSAYEAWKREQAAGAQGRAPVAVAPQPEAFDPEKHFAEAWKVPERPAHLERFVQGGALKQDTVTGRWHAAPGFEQIVTPKDADALNEYEQKRTEHLQKFLENPHKSIYETMQPAIDRLVEQRFEKAQAESAKAQYVQHFASQVKQYAEDQNGNPTAYGRALMQSLIPLKDSGLSHDAKLQIAHNAAVGQLAMQQHEQQRLAAYYAQQYGAPPQTQTYTQPQQVQQFAAPAPQAPAPQPHVPDFMAVASQSANASPFGSASEAEWQPKHLGELRERTFGQAARQLAGR